MEKKKFDIKIANTFSNPMVLCRCEMKSIFQEFSKPPLDLAKQ